MLTVPQHDIHPYKKMLRIWWDKRINEVLDINKFYKRKSTFEMVAAKKTNSKRFIFEHNNALPYIPLTTKKISRRWLGGFDINSYSPQFHLFQLL